MKMISVILCILFFSCWSAHQLVSRYYDLGKPKQPITASKNLPVLVGLFASPPSLRPVQDFQVKANLLFCISSDKCVKSLVLFSRKK